MGDFLKAFNRTGRFEGGFQANPDDNGNWTGGKKGVGVLVGTKFGFSAPELMRLLGRVPTKEDMMNLTIDKVQKVYKRDYWDTFWGDKVESQEICEQIYDEGINCGEGTAVKIAYRVAGLPEKTVMTQHLLDILNNKA